MKKTLFAILLVIFLMSCVYTQEEIEIWNREEIWKCGEKYIDNLQNSLIQECESRHGTMGVLVFKLDYGRLYFYIISKVNFTLDIKDCCKLIFAQPTGFLAKDGEYTRGYNLVEKGHYLQYNLIHHSTRVVVHRDFQDRLNRFKGPGVIVAKFQDYVFMVSYNEEQTGALAKMFGSKILSLIIKYK